MNNNTRRKGYMAFGAVLLFLLAFSGLTWAENVDLVTLPLRDGVQLTIYNSEDLTLVRETRTLSFKKGMNRLQFSWANTLIDPSSVEFSSLEKRDQISLVDTVYPGEKPTHLTWNIESSFEGSAKVQVTYFISGLTWSMDYTLVTNAEESELKFRGDITVTNNSGEDFEDASVRVIVGKINLVEKIADLARRRGIPVPAPAEPMYDKLKKEAFKDSIEFECADEEETIFEDEVAKEELSDYFLFSVSGTETVRNRTTKRMKAIEGENVTFDIVYRMRDYQYGNCPVKFLIWTNDKEHKLGDCPLPDGMLRVFRESEFGLSFLGGNWINYVPIKAKVEINLGTDPLVVYNSSKRSTKRGTFEFHTPKYQTKEFVKGWVETQSWIDSVRNYHNKPIKFELRRLWFGDIEFRSDLNSTLFDYQTVETIFTIEANGKKELKSTVEMKFGSRKIQDSIKLR